MTLKELEVGKSAVIRRVGGEGALRQHFLDMGMIPGAEVTVIKLALADILRSRGSVAAEEYREDGVFYRATVKIDDLHRFEPFLV